MGLADDALQAAVRFRLLAFDRGLPVTVHAAASAMMASRNDPGMTCRGEDRVKRDRTARLLTVVQVLRANGEHGVTPAEIAKRTGMAKRTVYRDLNAIQASWGSRSGARAAAGASRATRSCRRSA